jgi:hypothetical protein
MNIPFDDESEKKTHPTVRPSNAQNKTAQAKCSL